MWGSEACIKKENIKLIWKLNVVVYMFFLFLCISQLYGVFHWNFFLLLLPQMSQVPEVNKFLNATTMPTCVISLQKDITYPFPQRADISFPSLPRKKSTGGRTLMPQPNFLEWIVYQIFFPMELRSSKRLRAREELRYKFAIVNFFYFSR